MPHGDAREGKWRENWRMEWVASTLHTTSEHGVSRIITADVHTSAASSRLNWRPRRFKWARPYSRKTKSGFCACAITFQMQSTKCAITFQMQSTNAINSLALACGNWQDKSSKCSIRNTNPPSRTEDGESECLHCSTGYQLHIRRTVWEPFNVQLQKWITSPFENVPV